MSAPQEGRLAAEIARARARMALIPKRYRPVVTCPRTDPHLCNGRHGRVWGA